MKPRRSLRTWGTETTLQEPLDVSIPWDCTRWWGCTCVCVRGCVYVIVFHSFTSCPCVAGFSGSWDWGNNEEGVESGWPWLWGTEVCMDLDLCLNNTLIPHELLTMQTHTLVLGFAQKPSETCVWDGQECQPDGPSALSDPHQCQHPWLQPVSVSPYVTSVQWPLLASLQHVWRWRQRGQHCPWQPSAEHPDGDRIQSGQVRSKKERSMSLSKVWWHQRGMKIV